MTDSTPAPPDATGPRGGRSPLLFIFLTVFIDLLGFGIVLPLLPVYSLAYEASDLEIGLLFGSFSAMQLVFAPLWGRLSDRIGRRPVLIGGLIGTALSYLLFGFARSMPLLFASRLLAGFFGANISTAFAYVADVTTPENRAKGMGLIGAAFGLGFTLGPLVGGELTVLHPSYPGFFAAGLSLTAAIFGFFKLPEPPAAERTGSRVFGFDELRLVLSDGRIGLVLLLSFLAIVAFSSFEVLFIRFGLAEFPDVFGVPEAIASATTEQVLGAAPIAGRYLAFVGILAAVIQGGLIRRLVPRFGETSLIVAGPLFLALGLGMVGVASAWWMVLAACALMPFGFGINNPSLNSLLSRASPDAQQGAILGIGQSLASLARLVAPVTAYALFDRFDAHTPFLFAAGLLVLAAAIAAVYRARYGATFRSPS